MNKTKIPWCDYTWNPIVGCSPISAGCRHCYAAAISKRFGFPWGRAHFKAARLNEPTGVRKPSRIFVCSMGDIGHETVQPGWREQIFEAMRSASHHTYILLTKRPASLVELSEVKCLPPDTWVGVTIETQDEIARWGILRAAIPAAVHFVSVEPMLGQVSFLNWIIDPDWVIAGPETGPGARPCDPKWIEDLSAESKCFFDKRESGWTRREFPDEYV